MLAGPVDSGKTTFLQHLLRREKTYSKTQTIALEGNILDTPGEYLEHGMFNRALLLTSYDADLVLLFQSATAPETKLPPGFATYFTKPVLGVVTKVDIATAEEIGRARSFLGLAAAHDMVEVSSITGAGFDALVPRLRG